MSNFNNVWVWGDPMGASTYPKGKARSYADDMLGSQWLVMRTVTRKEFYRTLQLWRDLLHQRNGDIDLLHKVLEYDLEAKRLNVRNVQAYIADRVDRSQPAIHKYLQMIDIAALESELSNNYLYNDGKSHIVYDSAVSTWKPSKAEIRLKMAHIPRDCAAGYDGCKGNTQNGKFAICYPCHVKVSNDGKGFPEWLLSETRRIENDHRKYAVNACYEDHYGTISIDEADSYLDAA